MEHAPSPEELSRIYRESRKADPTSMDYERILVRPSVHPIRALLISLGVLTACFAIGLVSYLLSERIFMALSVGIGALLLTVFVFAKRILIWLVKVYQRTASDATRNRCRFEPSCSQYMIMALEKYGFFKGLIKGINRLYRCKPPGGGFDMP